MLLILAMRAALAEHGVETYTIRENGGRVFVRYVVNGHHYWMDEFFHAEWEVEDRADNFARRIRQQIDRIKSGSVRVQRSLRTGRVVCRCGKGYGSVYDGLCTRCRGGVSAWEAQHRGE